MLSFPATDHSYAPTIQKDENAVRTAIKGYVHGRVRPLVRALNDEVSDLHALISKLSHESASTARGATAKADPIKRIGLVASAYTSLRKTVQAAHGAPIPARKLEEVTGMTSRGVAKVRAGEKLLGLSD